MPRSTTEHTIISLPERTPPEMAPDLYPQQECIVTSIPTDLAHDHYSSEFKQLIAELEQQPAGTERIMGRLAATVALLESHPSTSIAFVASQFISTSIKILRETNPQGDYGCQLVHYPTLVKLIGHEFMLRDLPNMSEDTYVAAENHARQERRNAACDTISFLPEGTWNFQTGEWKPLEN